MRSLGEEADLLVDELALGMGFFLRLFANLFFSILIKRLKDGSKQQVDQQQVDQDEVDAEVYERDDFVLALPKLRQL